MVIKASTAGETRYLVDALLGADDVQREAAVARLSVIGSRVVARLLDAYDHTAERQAQIAILRTLEAIGDHRSAPLARQAIVAHGDVAVAATGVLRALLTSPNDTAAAAALDTLMATALDGTNEQRLRLAALEALQDAPADVRARVDEAMTHAPDRGLRTIARLAGRASAPAETVWSDAVDGRLPDDPQTLRDALAPRGGAAPLATLQKMIDAVRAKEEASRAAAREGWVGVRGALHQVLALRNSRVALYDLRETIEREASKGRAPHLPVSFLAALHVLGDASCLEPLAAAWSHSDPNDDRWRHQLAAAFQAIARREKISRRHAVMKRIAAKWPEAQMD